MTTPATSDKHAAAPLRARSERYFFIVALLGVCLFAALTFAFGKLVNSAMLVAIVIPLTAVWLLIRVGHPRTALHLFLGVFFLYQTILLYLYRGEASTGVIWFGVLPVMAATIGTKWDVLIWCGLALCGTALAWTYVADFPVFAHVLALPNLFGTIVIAAAMCFRFVSDRNKREAELLALAQKAQDAERRSTQFLASMSHELRMPMTTMQLSAEMLEEMDLDAAVGPAVRRLTESSRITLDLVNDVLDLAKLDADKVVPAETPVSLAPMLEDLRLLMEPHATASGCRLAIVHFPDVPLHWLGDAALLRQILVNLLSNAVKCTNRGVVILALSFDDDALVFNVTDTGTGIGTDHIESIFEPFAQFGQINDVGTGLGLTISREYARVLGGDLWLEHTQPGVGSSFVCRIPWRLPGGAKEQRTAPATADGFEALSAAVVPSHPLLDSWLGAWLDHWGVKKDHAGQTLDPTALYPGSIGRIDLLEAELGGRTRQRATGDRSPGATPTAPGEYVPPASHEPRSPVANTNQRYRGTGLICDDSDMVRDIMRSVLESVGYRGLNASNTAEARALLEREAVDFLLLDVQLESESGIDFLRTLRKPDSAFEDLPVCMISGTALMRQEAMDAGADDYLLKPPRLREITDVISRLTQTAVH